MWVNAAVGTSGYLTVELLDPATGKALDGWGVDQAVTIHGDSVATQVAVGCGPGRTMVNGVCVARTTIRQTRRAVRRCVRWEAGACALYQ